MKVRVEIEVGPTELREFLGLPDVATVQQEALDALVKKLRSGAASGSDAIAILRGMVPEGLTSVSEWQRLISRALQTGRPVSVEATVPPQDQATPRRAPGKPRKRSARKKSS
jgi:thiamine pyrophosphate-dependent acetolactate synthase large subunit-like protein